MIDQQLPEGEKNWRDIRPHFKLRTTFDNPLANISIHPLPSCHYCFITSAVFHRQVYTNATEICADCVSVAYNTIKC